MKPVGLTLKDREVNPFTGCESGEVVVVHECVTCGKIGLNRSAGDDNPYELTALLAAMPVSYKGIQLLGAEEITVVERALFGSFPGLPLNQ